MKNKNIKTTLLGASGLIGSHLLQSLLVDDSITEITIINRRKINYDHPKIKEKVIEFSDEKAFENAIVPKSIIFCAIGTTKKKVGGNKEKYKAVDYYIPVNAAKFGLKKDCDTFVLVSSMGADSKSSNFYPKLKGEVEDKVSNLGIDKLHIFRPSILLGDRAEFRLGERIAQFVMSTFSFLIPSKLKPILAQNVAKAMVVASKQNIKSKQIYHYKEIMRLADN